MKLEALIAYLASRTQIRGKKSLQKLVYFCQEAGVPLYATYRLHIYGPYSNEVAEELGAAVARDIVALDQDGFTFSMGSSCQVYLDQYRQEIDPYRDKIERVLARFGSCSPVELELYATVHFVASALASAYGQGGEDAVVEEVYRARGGKFARHQIRTAYRNLAAWGWLGEVGPV